MDSSVNPQPTDAHIRISHDFHRNLIRRKFTQRQRVIIDFILTLSWGCGKPSAIIPMLKHFELCGIRKGHIRKELTALVEANVLLWDESLNIFQINKHYDKWKVEHVDKFEPSNMNNLIALNLENKTQNLLKKVTEKGTELPKEEPKKVTKKVTWLLKRELSSYRKGNSSVTKKVTLTREYPCYIKRFQLSKTIIKAIIKKRTTTTTTTQPKSKHDYSYGNVWRAYQQNFVVGGKVTQFDVDEFSILFDDYGGDWLLQAMREAYRQGPDKRNMAYVHGVLKGYKERGGPDIQTEKKGTENARAPDQKTKQQQRSSRAAELRRLAEGGTT
ncbi:replication protein [Paenibacillus yanchengensis]|uniref:Replication protein n=1 Tax=Paenibacillus yanchengensis TaxID=2035833 RepID=A0ABW4YL34_9BACL